jgi:transposase-like protein
MTKSKRRTYDEPFKLEVLRDYYCSGMSKVFIVRKWSLSNPTVLSNWIKRYSFDSEALSLPDKTVIRYRMEHKEQSKEELLEQEVLSLKKALSMEKLRSRAFEKLIELAEQEEKLSILKKDGAKQ